MIGAILIARRVAQTSRRIVSALRSISDIDIISVNQRNVTSPT